MSHPVSKADSDAARAEGNAAFKKGRWSESIGRYTKAILHNPEDPLAYGNRAQAYLKLDKYADAERDCTIALEKQEGNIKALYRRALSRKGMEKFDEAIADLEALLIVEVANEAALEELKEIQSLRGRSIVAKAAKPKRSLAPIEAPTKANGAMPNPIPTPVPSPTSAPAPASAPTPTLEDVAIPAVEAAPKPPSTFSALKTTRASKKAAYIPPAAAPEPGPRSSTRAPEAVASPPVASAAIPPSTTSTKAAVPETTPPSSSRPASPIPIPTPPTDPNSTASGTGILLLRALTALPPRSGWALLRQYPPANIPLILCPILEPDSLGMVVLALAEADDEGLQKVRTIMEGLRRTPRFSMNTMMMDNRARVAGSAAWKKAGGEGAWP